MRLYTLEEARDLLPRLIPILEAMRDASVVMRRHMAMVQAGNRGAGADGNLTADPFRDDPDGSIERANEAFKTASEVLERLGIEVKDPERGLIDFYHEREGEVVFLCFLLGEPDIGHWHTLDGGFAGRRPI